MRGWRPLDSVIQEGLRFEEDERQKAAAAAAHAAAKEQAKAAKAAFAAIKAKEEAAFGISAEDKEEAEREKAQRAEVKRDAALRFDDKKKRRRAPRRSTGDEAAGAAERPRRAPRKGRLFTRKPQAQIVDGVRTTTFQTATAKFNGIAHQVQEFPHGMDPGVLRGLMGAGPKADALNADLHAARSVKYDSDLVAMQNAEDVAEAATAIRGDGSQLRMGNMQARKWQHSGFMCRRGLVMTWMWTKDYFILCDDVLYQFADGSLDATIVDAWPVLGASIARLEAPAKAHPWVLAFTPNAFYTDAPVLDTVQLSAPSQREREAWVRALLTSSVKVAKLFRKAGAPDPNA